MDGRLGAGDASATVDESRHAGECVERELDERDRRLRHRLRNVLQPDDEVDVAFVMSTTPSVVGGRFRLKRDDSTASSRRLALTVTHRGAVVVARLTRPAGSQLLQRYETAAAVGVTNVAPGDCYVEVAGRRYWVHGVWTYGLYQLHSRRAGAAPFDFPAPR